MESSNIKDVEVQKHSSGKLTKLYIGALAAVAVLTILGQILIQRSIKNQLNDSYIINMAGRQRYSSQEICKLAILIRDSTAHAAYPNVGSTLDSLLIQWKERQLGLLNGSETLNLPPTKSVLVKDMFSKTDAFFNRVYNNAYIISTESKKVQRDAIKIEKALRVLLNNEKVFLEYMNKIVYQYDYEARQKVLFLEKIELVLFVLTLLILVVEGVFIFRPISKKIKLVISELIGAEQKSNALTHKIKIANNSLSKTLKEIKGINYALELATIMIRTDRFGVITYANDTFCEIVKYSRTELIGQRLDMLSSQYHSQQFFDRLWETISNGNVWNDEIRNKAKDGSYVWLDTTIIPVLNDEHIPNQYIAIYTDLSEKFKQSVSEHKIRTSSVLEGQERERRKIARELHDGLGQMLTALKFNIQGIKPASTPEEQGYIDGIKNMLQDTILEVRRISFDLMPSVLNDFGLGAALRHLSERFSSIGKNNVKIEYVGLTDIGRFDKNTEINTYRIIQEALNNAIKYADASNIILDLQFEEGKIRFSVEDNGKGFTLQDKRRTDGSGRGMTNIRERVSLLNGNLIFNSIIGAGTTITVEIPAITI
jgi:PAS domain S-box-containing protein